MNDYAVCPVCGRGIGISKNGILRKHYKGATKMVCTHSGKSYKDSTKEKDSTKVVKKELCEIIRETLVREYGTLLSVDDTDRMLADAVYRSVRRYLRKKQII